LVMWTFVSKFVTNVGFMATHKKEKLPKSVYTTEENTESQLLSEPAAQYVVMADPSAMRSIVLMGMQGKKDFAQIKSENDFISVIRSGIPRQAMTHLMDIADLSLTEMAAIVHTSDRTLRRYTPNQKLSQDQSERMIEIAKLYSRGEEVFGTINDFRVWMDTMLLAFGNQKPREFLDTSIGISLINEELGRIQHGIFA
jgi:putative toxin-antitoxin system antitoxin component (TIGR02293 family)